MELLTTLEISGFKSIRRLGGLHLGRINVLIGANGAGKSNLISFFRMLHRIATPPGYLQFFVSKSGGADSLLHDGAARTQQIDAHLTVQGNTGAAEYQFKLAYAAEDTLFFADERYRAFPCGDSKQPTPWRSLGVGQREARLLEVPPKGDPAADLITRILRQCIPYQFHNTSETARVRQRWDVQDNHVLKEDGGNLAPFLLRLREFRPRAYSRVVETIRQVVPFFADFYLEPSDGKVLLKWRERNTDIIFGPHQASDGTLRVMALIALLLQPIEDVPPVIILDEPELGLHPSAIDVVAGLIKSVSVQRQVVLATQSLPLINYFEPEDIIVVDRHDRESEFRHLDSARLRDWLDEYSLGELWEKNVLGGRPG